MYKKNSSNLNSKDMPLILLLSSNVFTIVGTSFFTLAVSWIIYSMDQSLAQTSTVMIATQIAQIIFFPIAGIIADRANQKRIIVVCKLMALLLVVCFFYSFLFSKEHIIIFAVVGTFTLTLLNSLITPVEATILPVMVGKEKLAAVYGRYLALNDVSELIGQGMTGFILAWLGATGSFLLIIIFFLFAFVLILFCKIQVETKITPVEKNNPFKDFIEGWHYIKTFPYLKNLLWSSSFANVTQALLLLAAPAIAYQVGNGAQTLSYFMIAVFLGGIFGAIISEKLLGKITTGLAFGIFNLLVGLFVVGMVFTYSIVIICIAAFFMSFFTMLQNILHEKVILLVIDSEFRGRIKGLQSSIAMMLMPIAVLIGGLIGDMIGVRNLVLIGSLFTFIAAAICLLNKHIRSVFVDYSEKLGYQRSNVN